jgi:hypothetical protein
VTRTRSEKTGTVALTLSVIASLSYITMVLLNCAGVFVAERLGLFGYLAVGLAFTVTSLLAFVLTIRAIVKLQPFEKAYLALAISLLTFLLLRTGTLQRRVESWKLQLATRSTQRSS